MLQDQEQRVQRVLQLATQVGAIQKGHFAYTSGQHGDTYFDKDRLFTHSLVSWDISGMIAQDYLTQGIDTVVGPERGGAKLAQLVAVQLSLMTQREVLYAPAAKDNQGNFFFQSSYWESVKDKNCLVTEDIGNSGKSASKTVALTMEYAKRVCGVGFILIRGNVPRYISGVRISALAYMNLSSWEPKQCPMCEQDIPTSNELGHGGK